MSSAGERRIYCTGELADSLAEIEIFPIASVLADYFGSLSDARLELRTKSNRVAALLEAKHNGNTTVAFSISPQSQIDLSEPGTASLAERLAAAKQCQQAGYPVAFKFEPVIVTNDWQTQYTRAIEEICTKLEISGIEHVSVGCLRWSRQLMSTSTFSKHHRATIEGGAWIEYRPGIFNGTLPMSRRIEVYEWMQSILRQNGIAAPIWWSLEEPVLITKMAENQPRNLSQ